MAATKQVASGPLPLRDDLPQPLSSREREILELLATRGLSNKKIAEQLSVSPRTVDRHMENIFNKLGVDSRVAAVIWALQHGLALQENKSQVIIRREDHYRNTRFSH